MARFWPNRLLFLSLFGLGAAGCSEYTIDGYSPSEGSFCFNTKPAPAGPTGQPQFLISAQITHNSCASGCTRVTTAKCTSEVVGAEVRLSPTVESTTKSEGECATACTFVGVTCEVPTPVPAGTYTVLSGERSIQLQVPAPKNKCPGTSPFPAGSTGGLSTAATGTLNPGVTTTGTGTSTDKSSTQVIEPKSHRPTDRTCPPPPASAPVPPERVGSCRNDSECSQGINGRCVLVGSNKSFCAYDECNSSSDCAEGSACACRAQGPAQVPALNRCKPSNCRFNQQCGPTGYCSATLGFCGPVDGVVGFYCRTAQDQCVEHGDCISPSGARGNCIHNAQGFWNCSYTVCGQR